MSVRRTSLRARIRNGGIRGFTLVEALVALSILAVALMASIRAAGVLNTRQAELQSRLSAQWSAENLAHELRLRGAFPTAGTQEQPCPQGQQAWYCVVDISNTPNPNFRRIEIRVYDGPPKQVDQNTVARLMVFLARLP
jgi:general secretion pathway protein I